MILSLWFPIADPERIYRRNTLDYHRSGFRYHSRPPALSITLCRDLTRQVCYRLWTVTHNSGITLSNRVDNASCPRDQVTAISGYTAEYLREVKGDMSREL